MALTVVTPDGLDITGNYLFNGLNVAGNLVTGNATVTGNLIVNGDTIYANVTTLNVKDPIIEQGGNPNGSPLSTNDSKDRGSLLHYYSSSPVDAFMGWDTSNGEFSFGSNVTVTNNVVTFNTLGNVRADYFLGNGSQLTGIAATTANSANTANTANTVTTSAQPNITSVGTLTSLTVTGNITAGNVNGANAISANFFLGDGGLLTNIATGATNAISSGTSNVRVDANSNVRVSVAGVANILVVSNTGATINGSANVTGNLTAGNIISNGGVGGSITGANLVSANFITGTLTTAAQPNITSIGSLSNLTVTGNITAGNISGNGQGLSSISGANVTGAVATATLATTATSATVAATVTTNAQPNITSVGTLSNLTVTGNVSGNYFIGNGSLLTGLSTGTPNSLVNGNSNVIVDANSNVRVSVTGNANILVITGTSAIVNGDANVTGNLTAGNIISNGGAGGSITGANLVSANFFTGTLTTSAQPNITSVGTLSNLTVTGNSVLGNVSGNGAGLSNIAGANITGTVANATNATLATSATSATVAATVTTNAQPNITSVGTLTSLDVTGNVSANYFIGNGALLTGIASGNSTAIVNGTSNVIVDLNSNVRIGAAGNANIVVVTGTGVVFNGNANIVGTLTTGNLTTAGSGGNISGANNITANTFTGTLATNAQPNITSVGNLTSLTVTGNVTSGNANLGNAATANFFIGNLHGTANSAVTATTATSATIAATVTTNAQPNITSVGTLTSLAVTGNAQFSGANVSLGNVSNLKITGGSNTQVLSTDGTGNLSWVTQSGGGASGIAVQDEGSNVVTVANIINFVGSGVTASNVGGVATITVSGGGGGAANIVIRNEGNILTNSVSSIDFVGSGVDATVVGNAVTVTVSSGGGSGSQAAIFSDTFTGNGVQTAFVLSTIPDSIDSTFVNIDGVSQLRTAYTLSGSTLTFTSAPIAAAEIEVTTIQSVVSGYSNLTTRNYTGNGVQTTFAVTSGVTATSLLVTENGVLQTPGTDYTVSSANLIFDGAPANGVNIQVRELQTVIPEPVGEGLVYSRSSMIATAGQTNFAVVYSVGYLQVYLNGVLLNATDYVATTGITIVLDEAAAAGDLLEIITYNLIPFNQIQAATFNSTNLTNNMVITSGYSAVSVGPLSVADGVTISIAAGQKWVIL